MKKLLLAAALLVLSVGAYAQIEAPVKWSYAAKRVSATEAVVFLRATIQGPAGIFIRSMLKDGGPIKTSFTFHPIKRIQLNW